MKPTTSRSTVLLSHLDEHNIFPERGFRTPVINFKSVDLPDALGPFKNQNSPSLTVHDRFSMIGTDFLCIQRTRRQALINSFLSPYCLHFDQIRNPTLSITKISRAKMNQSSRSGLSPSCIRS